MRKTKISQIHIEEQVFGLKKLSTIKCGKCKGLDYKVL